ncbi:MAG: PIN domain-containing protein [Anaerolineaceae bacterium]|nr:PIN domain-containing protein [Anaerolineaceae bacterium]
MAKKPVVMIDINILMDVLQKREPFYGSSAGLLAAVETGQVHGYVAAHSLTTLFYLVQKSKSSAEARVTITNLLQFIQVAPVDQSTIEQALNLETRDFEDAVQMVSAVQCKADFLITRNVKDFQPALLPVLAPVDFLGTL